MLLGSKTLFKYYKENKLDVTKPLLITIPKMYSNY